MDSVHEETKNGLTIKIFRDENAEGPDAWGDSGLYLTADHRQFYVKGEAAPEETHWRFGLEAYIHSGVQLALSSEGNFPDRRWDVSQLGLVFVSKKEWPTIKAARKAALGLIENWNDYLSGNVYGFQVLDAQDEVLDSCWGFSGDYDAEDGALAEARGIVDHLTHKGTTDEKGQYLMAFMAA